MNAGADASAGASGGGDTPLKVWHSARFHLCGRAGDGGILRGRIMSGGQSASVVLAMSNEIALLPYPPAAASAVVLMLLVMLMVAAILRLVDVRKEVSG